MRSRTRRFAPQPSPSSSTPTAGKRPADDRRHAETIPDESRSSGRRIERSARRRREGHVPAVILRDAAGELGVVARNTRTRRPTRFRGRLSGCGSKRPKRSSASGNPGKGTARRSTNTSVGRPRPTRGGSRAERCPRHRPQARGNCNTAVLRPFTPSRPARTGVSPVGTTEKVAHGESCESHGPNTNAINPTPEGRQSSRGARGTTSTAPA